MKTYTSKAPLSDAARSLVSSREARVELAKALIGVERQASSTITVQGRKVRVIADHELSTPGVLLKR